MTDAEQLEDIKNQTRYLRANNDLYIILQSVEIMYKLAGEGMIKWPDLVDYIQKTLWLIPRSYNLLDSYSAIRGIHTIWEQSKEKSKEII